MLLLSATSATMAESASKTDDSQTSNENTVTQPSNPLPMNEVDEGKEQTEDKKVEDTPAAQSSAAPVETDTASKGKDKDEPPPPVEKQRADDSLSIGPPDVQPPEATASNVDSPVCTITLLLPTGARHPYKIDEKYLAKRNVDVPDVTESGGGDPFSISVYKLKELILREWREEWEGRPASPSSIRLIHFGKLLDDKEQLKSEFFAPFANYPVKPTGWRLTVAQSTNSAKTAPTLSTCRCAPLR